MAGRNFDRPRKKYSLFSVTVRKKNRSEFTFSFDYFFVQKCVFYPCFLGVGRAEQTLRLGFKKIKLVRVGLQETNNFFFRPDCCFKQACSKPGDFACNTFFKHYKCIHQVSRSIGMNGLITNYHFPHRVTRWNQAPNACYNEVNSCQRCTRLLAESHRLLNRSNLRLRDL